MAKVVSIDLLSENPREQIAETVADRLSKEVVIALVGPVGSGVSMSAQYLSEILSQDFGYAVAPIIKPSDFIRAEARRVGISKISESPLSVRIDEMQTAGNKLREKFGADYLAEKTIEKIVAFRRDQGGYTGAIQLPKRIAYIIDSIKNMDELQLLRQIYGDTLCVFGIFAPDAIRKKRLMDDGIAESDVQKIIDRDGGEVGTFGQMTKEIFVKSDFFICNDQKKEELRRRISRYLEILFDVNIHTPTRSESAMYEASAAAAMSACMSRQVGAAIVSSKGELIAIGQNDVPKFGGGLYTEDDQAVFDHAKGSIQDKDHRCFKWGTKICHNEVRRKSILDSIAEKIFNSGLLKKGAKQEEVRTSIAGTEVESLTEFSRSIHAEMAAILSVAREGRHSLVGATLYTTTYPCHNCARHIVAAGISQVIYILPYEKSLAIVLHNDAISEDPDDKTHVVFRQYDGVAPMNYLKLFTPVSSRKSNGSFLRSNPKAALPIFRMPLDAPSAYEDKIIADLSAKESAGS
jgi:deoxycytidylate deaminase